MIHTVTFNPSLDYVVSVPDFALGKTNRTTQEQMFPGGKGINVSIVLNDLGIPTTALGFLAGFTGAEIRRRLTDMGIGGEFIFLDSGSSRINVKLKNEEGTEINGMGPAIPAERLDALLEKLDGLSSGDGLVLAGSIPSSVANDIYGRILNRLAGKEILSVVDATGELLKKALPYRPFLVKPNHQELGALFGRQLDTVADLVLYGKRLQTMGARNVLVSMGGKGAVLICESGLVLHAPAPAGRLVNAVGAGDSMVAGFLAGWQMSRDWETAFRMALAAGSASAFSETLASREAVMTLFGQIHPEKLS